MLNIFSLVVSKLFTNPESIRQFDFLVLPKIVSGYGLAHAYYHKFEREKKKKPTSSLSLTCENKILKNCVEHATLFENNSEGHSHLL